MVNNVRAPKKKSYLRIMTFMIECLVYTYFICILCTYITNIEAYIQYNTSILNMIVYFDQSGNKGEVGTVKQV